MDEEYTSEPATQAPPVPVLPASLPPSYFETLYQISPDPWNFEGNEYDAARHATILASLPREHYRSGLEIGSSIGIMTEKLASRCDALLSIDVSQLALQKAKVRCRKLSQVRFELRQVPGQFPTEKFDLILFSEVGYYLSLEDLVATRQHMIEQLEPGGHLLLVHWLPPVAGNPLSGDVVHETFLQAHESDFRHLSGTRGDFHRLDLFERS